MGKAIKLDWAKIAKLEKETLEVRAILADFLTKPLGKGKGKVQV